MKTKTIALILVLLLSLVQMVEGLSAPVQSNESPVDGSQLSSDLTQLCIDLNDSDGDNMYWEIRQGGNVLENGTPFSYPTHTYNFTDSINNTAYWECSPTSLRMTSETEFSSSEYTNISLVDSLNTTTNCTSYDWAHHHFLFNITEDKYDVTNIAVNWHGYAGYYTGGAKPKWYWDATMYIKKGTWGSGVNSTPTPYTGTPSLEWFNYSIANGGYIDGTGTIEIAVENSVAGAGKSMVYTDYIEVIITYVTGGDPNGTYCTNNVSFWNNNTCEEWWTWSVFVDDGHHNSYTIYYTFQNMPCVLSGYFHPVDNSTDICPCCDAMCFGIGALYEYVNVTVYRSTSRPTVGTEQTYMFPVWAEENAVLAANSYEWAFGNGANTPADGGETIYVPEGWNCSAVAMSLRLGSGTANVTLLINGVLQLSTGCVEVASGQSATHEFPTPLYIENNDYINFRTSAASGTSSPNVVTVWLKMTKTENSDNANYTVVNKYINITNGTYCFCLDGHITDGMYRPMHYNTTYYWYVYVENYQNNSLNITSSTYQFTTATIVEDCGCGDDSSYSGYILNDKIYPIIGLFGLFGLIGFFIERRRRRRD